MAGGHSVDDNEPKFGLAVTGRVHPDRILTNRGCRQGMPSYLPNLWVRGSFLTPEDPANFLIPDLEAILPLVAALNAKAIETALNYEIHACTDITGFGILGHTLEMAKGSGVQIELDYDQLPFYPNALKMYQQGETTGSNQANRKLAERFLGDGSRQILEEEELCLIPRLPVDFCCLCRLPRPMILLAALKEAGVDTAARVGQVVGDGSLL